MTHRMKKLALSVHKEPGDEKDYIVLAKEQDRLVMADGFKVRCWSHENPFSSYGWKVGISQADGIRISTGNTIRTAMKQARKRMLMKDRAWYEKSVEEIKRMGGQS